MTDNPHFAFPFRIRGGRAGVREQDDSDEIMDAAAAVLGTHPRTRTDLPAFGIRELAFTRVNVKEITSVLDRWEPRASYMVMVQPDALDAMIRRVTIYVKGNSNA